VWCCGERERGSAGGRRCVGVGRESRRKGGTDADRKQKERGREKEAKNREKLGGKCTDGKETGQRKERQAEGADEE